jgi:hypothetical protein
MPAHPERVRRHYADGCPSRLDRIEQLVEDFRVLRYRGGQPADNVLAAMKDALDECPGARLAISALRERLGDVVDL